MIEWRRGSLSGSVNKLVRREVEEQLRGSSIVRRTRYSLAHRAIRSFFRLGTFPRFVGVYLAIVFGLVGLEALGAWPRLSWFPALSASSANKDTESLLLNVSSYLASTQASLLGAVSLALALVTLIAQRENSSTDVQLYYHESLSFEIVASCMALLAVLCAQFLWPLQALIHYLGLGSGTALFKSTLLVGHVLWLVINISAIGYFIATTFRFVQQAEREMLRERYTVNVVQPRDMTQRLRHQIYGLASQNLIGSDDEENASAIIGEAPSVTFGFEYGPPRIAELQSRFKHPVALNDVRMLWVGWVVRRWRDRCVQATKEQPATKLGRSLRHGPLLWFALHLDDPVQGHVNWCWRRGGVPLKRFEKFVLRRAFCFMRCDDEA